MSSTLKITSGQHSDAGIKDSNDDACGVRVPDASLIRISLSGLTRSLRRRLQ
jgi:hypothetical protein